MLRIKITYQGYTFVTSEEYGCMNDAGRGVDKLRDKLGHPMDCDFRIVDRNVNLGNCRNMSEFRMCWNSFNFDRQIH
jgi:hypothetical protein